MITNEEVRMTMETRAIGHFPNREIARQLDMIGGNVRYHLRRTAAGAVDGRWRQRHRLSRLFIQLCRLNGGKQLAMRAANGG